MCKKWSRFSFFKHYGYLFIIIWWPSIISCFFFMIFSLNFFIWGNIEIFFDDLPLCFKIWLNFFMWDAIEIFFVGRGFIFPKNITKNTFKINTQIQQDLRITFIYWSQMLTVPQLVLEWLIFIYRHEFIYCLCRTQKDI